MDLASPFLTIPPLLSWDPVLSWRKGSHQLPVDGLPFPCISLSFPLFLQGCMYIVQGFLPPPPLNKKVQLISTLHLSRTNLPLFFIFRIAYAIKKRFNNTQRHLSTCQCSLFSKWAKRLLLIFYFEKAFDSLIFIERTCEILNSSLSFYYFPFFFLDFLAVSCPFRSFPVLWM